MRPYSAMTPYIILYTRYKGSKVVMKSKETVALVEIEVRRGCNVRVERGERWRSSCRYDKIRGACTILHCLGSMDRGEVTWELSFQQYISTLPIMITRK
jgi:hypothetical protein